MEKLGLNWVYLPLPVAPERLADAVAGVRAMGFVGVNITIPHKEAVMALLDELDPLSRAIGAVNTIHFAGGHAVGYNTDAEGYTRTVAEEGGFDFRAKSVVQIGAGGAGRAMAAGAVAAGAARVSIYDIDAARLDQLVADLAAHYPAASLRALSDPARLREAALEADLIANATPLGMRPGDPLPLSAECLQARHTVFDAVYVKARTPLLAAAEERGARVVPGLGMLARQGARSLEIWSGLRPDEQLMIQVLKEKLAATER
jgi:shikimate dehydrogenase